MYKINPGQKTLEQLGKRTFAELNFREREDLQEWIANQPEILGEELLIIQKEFAGFSETRERLDLLALDKDGALVIIENKLDDSGRDVTWQALKYTSYCSGFSKENIKSIYQDYLDKFEPGAKAEQNISEFFDEDYSDIVLNPGVTQRIILIAAEYRKEVTSTVLWLLNYNIRVQCFVATPYSMGDEVFLTVDQIIPTRDTEEFMIRIAEKTKDDIAAKTSRQKNLLEYWNKLLLTMQQKSPDYAGKFRPTTRNIINAGTGMPYIRYRMVARTQFTRVVIIMFKKNPHSEYTYNELAKRKQEIHTTLGYDLVWLEIERAFLIRSECPGNISDKSQWDKTIESQVDHFIQIEKAFRAPLKKIFQQLENSAK